MELRSAVSSVLLSLAVSCCSIWYSRNLPLLLQGIFVGIYFVAMLGNNYKNNISPFEALCRMAKIIGAVFHLWEGTQPAKASILPAALGMRTVPILQSGLTG